MILPIKTQNSSKRVASLGYQFGKGLKQMAQLLDVERIQVQLAGTDAQKIEALATARQLSKSAIARELIRDGLKRIPA